VKYLSVDYETWGSSVNVPVWPGGETENLFIKWKESGLDEDFDTLADWIRDDVAGEIELDITDARIVEAG